MNSLTITLKTSETERYVPNEVITTLYNIGKDDDKHQSLTSGVDTTDSNRPVTSVAGSVAVRVAYADLIEYLATKFPNLNISADATYIHFKDPEVERVLLAAGIGDGTGITPSDAAGAQANKFTNLFKENTTISKFNEFKYFTKANQGSHYGLFCDATNLEEIDLSEATFIGGWLFRATSLKTLNVPNLQNINGLEAFCRCPKLTSVLNLGLISLLPKMTFNNCSVLSNVVLPESCIAMLESCFAWTDGLSDINLQNVESFGPTAFLNSSLSNVSANNMLNAKTIGNLAFYNTKLFGVLNLPKLITIGNLAFDRCSRITGIECLGKLSTIGSRGFYGTGVTYAKLPYECTTIGSSAFQECSNLTSIKQYTDSIDNWIEGAEPTTGPLSRVTSFGQNCFYNCRLLSLTNDDISGATSIGEYAFRSTLLYGSIDLPNVTSIGRSAFEYTKITSVINLGSVTKISSGCFYGCKELTNIIIRPGITVIEGNAFAGTNLSNIILPHGFETFGDGGTPIRDSCNNITYMQFPSTTTKINFWDIYRDGNPVTAFCVVLATTPPNTGRDSNNTTGAGIGWGWGRPLLSRWYVPDSVVSVYKENEQWSPLADYIFPISQLETDSPVNWLLYQTNKDYGVS